MKEKHQTTFASAVNDVPQCFPALLRAQKAAKRVEKGGWKTNAKELIEIINESLQELVEGSGNKAETLGKLLLCVAWLSHLLGENCEQALLDTVVKTQRLYSDFEAAVLKDGLDVNALTKEQFKKYYDGATDELV